jgi:thiol-disulfide isomerase/thioredoxin/mono/diheme cytochrome c family protein
MRAAVLATVAIAALAVAGEPKPAPIVGAKLADWALPRADTGKRWSLADDGRDAKAVVVAFLGTECPVSNAYAPILSALSKQYESKGVLFVGVYSNRQDDAASVAKHIKEFSIPFVALKDEGAVLADRFAAKRTPEAFVLDGTRTVRYRGRIDDQIDKGIKRPTAETRDLVDALNAVLAGQAVTKAVTEPAGCFIGRKPKAKEQTARCEPVTYSKQVARVLQKNCQECHRPGEAAPFKLMNCDDATAWSEAIREAVSEKRMPPWYADDKDKGKFKNDRTLSDEDRTALLNWVEQGCPEGDPAELPPARTYPDGWTLGKPDEIFTMSEPFPVPAVAPKGGVPYQYFFVGEPFKEDKWVQSVEAIPGVRGVVHHIIVFVKPPPKRAPRPGASPIEQVFTDFDFKNPDGFGEMFLGGYAPGTVPFTHGPGYGKKIAKGSRLVFELHYTPNGTACMDRSSIGLVYCKEPPKHQVRTRTVMTEKFLIPPLTPNHKVEVTTEFDRPVVVLAVGPHMHLRGKSFTFDLATPDAKNERLLSVPKYDFNWQIFYEFAEPRRLPKGSQIHCVAHFDNSKGNPNNPNPWQPVMFGLQTWEEMMVGFVDYYDDDTK